MSEVTTFSGKINKAAFVPGSVRLLCATNRRIWWKLWGNKYRVTFNFEVIDDTHTLHKGLNMKTELRPSVQVFAEAMERALRTHDATKGNQNGANGRPGWRQDPTWGLVDHAIVELLGIQEALTDERDDQKAAYEAVDLANMAMMIWDNLLQLPEATDPN